MHAHRRFPFPFPPLCMHAMRQVISEELGYKMESVDIAALGSAKRVTLTKDDTIILHGGGKKEAIHERCEMIRQAMELTTSDYDRWGHKGGKSRGQARVKERGQGRGRAKDGDWGLIESGFPPSLARW
jgi:chaperonin GroEL (HSP60 family)